MELNFSQGEIGLPPLQLQTGNTSPPLSRPGISATREQYFLGFITGILWDLLPHPAVLSHHGSTSPSLWIEGMRFPCSHACPTFLRQAKVCREREFLLKLEQLVELEEKQ